MAITRAQQARQMLKEGSEPVVQGGVDNYLGKQPQVVVPRKWQSGPDKPPTELAYITEAEKKLLLKEDIHGSLKEGPNEGPAGIMSLDSFGDIGGAGAAGVDTKASGGAKSDKVRFGPTQSGAGGINKPMSPADVKLEEQRLQTITRNEEKKAKEFTKQAKKQRSFLNNLKKFGLPTQRILYGAIPNNPNTELAFLSGLTQEQVDALDNKELSDLYGAIQDADFSGDLSFKDALGDAYGKLSYDAFRTLSQRGIDTNFQDPQGEFGNMDFAEYAARIKGKPGLLFSGDVGGLQTIKNPDGTFSYKRRSDDGSPQGESELERRLRLLEEKQQQAIAPTTLPDRNLAGLSPRIAGSIFDFTGLADGGRVAAAEGGIMELARQEMFLGGIAKGIKKAVKGVSRTIKKVAKSPIGKIALAAAAGGFGLGLGPFAKGASLGAIPGAGFLKGAGVKNFALSNLSGKGIASIIGGASLLPLLMGPKEEEDEFDIAEYYRRNALNPNAPLNMRIAGSQFAFADGGRIGYSDGMEAGAMSEKEMKKLAKSPLYKGFKKMYGIDPSMAKGNKAYDEKFDMFEKLFKKGFAEGGDVEPVAKKTMPLLDMDGQEMDLRAEGGFVPIGRMEKADDVPARLSKNEFVFTADAVRNAGDGNVDKGAEVMYNMMKNLESGGDVSEESQGLSGAREMFQTSKRLEEVL